MWVLTCVDVRLVLLLSLVAHLHGSKIFSERITHGGRYLGLPFGLEIYRACFLSIMVGCYKDQAATQL